ncbi:hypothetical protein BKM69_15080, partial [Listeria monocytogenes]
DEVILVTDHTKFGRISLYKYAALDEISSIITGKRNRPSIKKNNLKKKGMQNLYNIMFLKNSILITNLCTKIHLFFHLLFKKNFCKKSIDEKAKNLGIFYKTFADADKTLSQQKE